MSGKRAREQRRRAGLVQALQDAGYDKDISEHMVDRQIAPQDRAARARAQGLDIDVALVNTTPGVTGYPVTCHGCGRTATLPYPLPPDKPAALCPDCQARGTW